MAILRRCHAPFNNLEEGNCEMSRPTESGSMGDTDALVERMASAVDAFLSALDPRAREKAQFAFDNDAERTFWAYTPIERGGLPLCEMSFKQRQLAQQVVATGLSRAGYVTASTIMGLEQTLDFVESWQRPGLGRDPQLYYLSIFGDPSSTGPWGWRYEGHHISLNYTIIGGKIVAPTPTFFGANPAESPMGTVGFLRPLGGVEDLARALIHSLDEKVAQSVIISPVAPDDIVMRNRRQVEEGALDREGDDVEAWRREKGLSQAQIEALRYRRESPAGSSAATFSAEPKRILRALLREYIQRMPDDLAAIEMEKLERNGLDVFHFAWAGPLERHQPHYYRVQAPSLLIEYDNTQNDANHIHSVWRDPANDFGRDLLAEHYDHDH